MVSYKLVLYLSGGVLLFVILYGVYKIITYEDTSDISKNCIYIKGNIIESISYDEFKKKYKNFAPKNYVSDVECSLLTNSENKTIFYCPSEKAVYEAYRDCKGAKDILRTFME